MIKINNILEDLSSGKITLDEAKSLMAEVVIVLTSLPETKDITVALDSISRNEHTNKNYFQFGIEYHCNIISNYLKSLNV